MEKKRRKIEGGKHRHREFCDQTVGGHGPSIGFHIFALRVCVCLRSQMHNKTMLPKGIEYLFCLVCELWGLLIMFFFLDIGFVLMG